VWPRVGRHPGSRTTCRPSALKPASGRRFQRNTITSSIFQELPTCSRVQETATSSGSGT
jgi:hypothetical protein